MKLANLQHGQIVTARFSRRDNEDGTAPEWGDWQQVTLYLRRRDKPLPKLRRRDKPLPKGYASKANN